MMQIFFLKGNRGRNLMQEYELSLRESSIIKLRNVLHHFTNLPLIRFIFLLGIGWLQKFPWNYQCFLTWISHEMIKIADIALNKNSEKSNISACSPGDGEGWLKLTSASALGPCHTGLSIDVTMPQCWQYVH